MKHLNRRQALGLLGAAGAAAALLSSPVRVLATPASDSRFLLVFMRGGYDAANLLVPYASSFYYEARRTIAIAPPSDADESNVNAAIRLDERWGLHPALRESMLPLWTAGQLAFVPFAGSTDLTRSHFETQDTIESGQPPEGPRAYGSGFMNRLAEALGGNAGGVSFTDALPPCWQGAAGVPNLSLKNYGKASFDDRQAAALSALYRNTRWSGAVEEGLQLRRDVAQQYEAEQMEASRSAISTKGFELEAKRMGRLLRDRFNIGFIDVGGWDTHVNEGGAQGTLATNLGNLGRGLAAFAAEMGPAWRKTTVVVVSEFGRTFRENGTRGTDHGHGSVYWVLGGSVRGGRVASAQVDITPDTLNQNRDWPVLTDVRGLLGGLFMRQYGLDDTALASVFPRTQPLDLGLL